MSIPLYNVIQSLLSVSVSNLLRDCTDHYCDFPQLQVLNGLVGLAPEKSIAAVTKNLNEHELNDDATSL